jgi:uncharacterized protein YndB with AHSA1/START domain
MSEAPSPESANLEPLSLAFEVDCPVEHAFTVWTSRIDTWWPADHTVSGRSDARIAIEPRSDGRIFERTPDGVEHDWGQVTVWEPPHRLSYRWHLMRDRGDATDVDIRFLEHGAATRIEIEHRGWQRLDAGGDQWRERNRLGWQSLLPHYLTATAKGDL